MEVYIMNCVNDNVEYNAFDLRTIGEDELCARAERVIGMLVSSRRSRRDFPESSEIFLLVVERFRHDPVTARRLARLTLWWMHYTYLKVVEPESIVRQADQITDRILDSAPYSGE
jgi:hypothetical protein